VGHGIRAVEDEGLVAALAQRHIPLEVSITCNVALKFSPSVAEHPFRHLEAAGVLVTVNTDDPVLVGTTLTQEYEQLKSVLGYSDQSIIAIARNAFQVCAAEAPLKKRLLQEFDEWAASTLRQA
jgi:adenosine deaminase